MFVIFDVKSRVVQQIFFEICYSKILIWYTAMHYQKIVHQKFGLHHSGLFMGVADFHKYRVLDFAENNLDLVKSVY